MTSIGRPPQGARQGYEIRMVLVTSLVISFVAFDRLATGYIGPYLIAALDLTNTQLGAIYSTQAVAVAIAGYAIGRLSDRTGKRKQLLVLLLILAAICAMGSLLVQGYIALLAIRLASGAALGGISPITQSILTSQSPPERIGRNIGVQTLLMFLVSQMLGPIVLSRIADAWGWQAAYVASAIPFLLLAAGVWLVIREFDGGARPAEDVVGVGGGRLTALARRRIGLCIAISAGFMFWLVVHATFLSIYLVEKMHYTPTGAGTVLGTLGLAGCVGGLALPLLSDRFGRKAMLTVGMGLAAIVPTAILLWTGPAWGLQLLLFTGWLAVGALPIYAVLIPGETVPPARIAATVAVTIGVGEIAGGVVGPILAGQLADAYGIAAPFWVALAVVLVCFLLSLLIPQGDVSRVGEPGLDAR
jgi:ACS family hexuronate transporter-like MFS transporter